MIPSPLTPEIILPTHEFAPRRGGIATYVEETARATIRAGHRTSVWAGGAPVSAPASFPFAYTVIGNRGSLDWPCLWKTAAILRARRASVEQSTLCLAEPGPIFTYLYQPLLHLPWPRRLVLVLHGSEILRLASWPHRRLGFRRLLRRATTIGVVSAFTASLLRENFPGFEHKTVLVPGALRSDFRHPPTRSRPDDREIRILTVARLHPRKGLHRVIQAIAGLAEEERARVLYLVIGPASRVAYVTELTQLAAKAGVRIKIRHDDAELLQSYADADIFALTSENSPTSVESFGLVYLEAGACGLPVLAHATGGVPEVVRSGENGLLVQPGDLPGLTQALSRLIAAPELRKRLGEGGKRRAASFSWDDNVRRLFPISHPLHADSVRR